MSATTLRLAIALALAVPARGAVAQSLPPAFNPATYRSSSGEYVLEVDPSHIYGQGAATYRLTRAGREVWAGEKPFTLLAAGVSDEGVVAGYSYDSGVWFEAENDVLHLRILDPLGDSRRDDRSRRRLSLVLHGGAEPVCHGLVFDPAGDRVTFRVSRKVNEPETWRPFRLSTGAALKDYRPDSGAPRELSLFIVAARPVPDTPLTLVHWHRAEYTAGESGARFTLNDASGRAVWGTDFPRAYQAPFGQRQEQDRLNRLIHESALLDGSRPGEFGISVAATREHVSYRAARLAKNKWNVQEVSRETIEGAAATTPTAIPKTPERPLYYRGVIALGRGGPSDRVMRGVQDFDVDDRGRLGFARDEGDGRLTLVLTSREDAETPKEVPVGPLGGTGEPRVAWTGTGTWLVAREYGTKETGGGFWADVDAGLTRPLDLPDDFLIHGIAGRPEGGALVVGQQRSDHGAYGSISTSFLWLDARGRPETTPPNGIAALDGYVVADDFMVTPSGDVLFADPVAQTVDVHAPDGSQRSSIDLGAAWGYAPRYPSGITRDTDGGFLIDDFGAEAPFVRMNADGTMRGRLRPRYEDGRPTGRLFRVRPGPDGHLWGSDGEALLLLNEDGLVVDSIGPRATADTLGEVAAITLDGRDWIHAVDRRTGAVHVFDADGTLDHLCRPQAGDIGDALWSPSLTVTADGRVFLRSDQERDDEAVFLEFSATGERLAARVLPDADRRAHPGTGGFWLLHRHHITSVDAEGKMLRTIERRPDRNWLDVVSGAMVAPDGSLAVASESGAWPAESNGWALSLYAADGEPLRVLPQTDDVSKRHFAYDGRHLVLWEGTDLVVRSAGGDEIARFVPRPRGQPVKDWPLLLAAGGRELWMLDNATRSLHRYEMP